MFQQLISRISQDDNPRLHRTPFLLLWIASYAAAWFLPRFYECLIWDYRLTDLRVWLKGSYNNREWWREDLLLGILFATVLAFMLSWLLKRRYGFVPQFFTISTFVGATLGGFGFPRIGLSHLNGLEFLPLDFMLWFGTVAIFQAIAVLRTSRQGWIIAAVGLLAGVIANAIYIPLHVDSLSNYSAEFGLLIGTIIQASGSGIAILNIMADTRKDTIPKRKVEEKAKTRIYGGFHPLIFVGLWLAIYFMGFNIMMLVRDSYNNFVGYRAFISENEVYWIVYGLAWAIAGFVMAIGQKWLLRQMRESGFQHWIIVSTIGWFITGASQFMLWFSDYGLVTHRFAWLVIFLIAPMLLQSIVIMREIPSGWLWLTSASPSIIVSGFIFYVRYYINYLAISTIIGHIMVIISTGVIFAYINARQTKFIKQTD